MVARKCRKKRRAKRAGKNENVAREGKKLAREADAPTLTENPMFGKGKGGTGIIKVDTRFVPPKDLKATKSAQEQLVRLEKEVRAMPASSSMTAAQRGTIAACFSEIRSALDGAVLQADPELLRAVVATQGKKHARAYDACHEIVKDDAGHRAMCTLAKQAAALQTGISIRSRRRTCAQPTRNLTMLYGQARETLPLFEAQMEVIVAQFMFTGSNIVKNALAVKLKLATLKHLYRCMEKMCFKVGENRYQAESVCDIVRCIISCDDCGQMSAVLAAIMADQKLRVVRVKVRGRWRAAAPHLLYPVLTYLLTQLFPAAAAAAAAAAAGATTPIIPRTAQTT